MEELLKAWEFRLLNLLADKKTAELLKMPDKVSYYQGRIIQLQLDINDLKTKLFNGNELLR